MISKRSAPLLLVAFLASASNGFSFGGIFGDGKSGENDAVASSGQDVINHSKFPAATSSQIYSISSALGIPESKVQAAISGGNLDLEKLSESSKLPISSIINSLGGAGMVSGIGSGLGGAAGGLGSGMIGGYPGLNQVSGLYGLPSGALGSFGGPSGMFSGISRLGPGDGSSVSSGFPPTAMNVYGNAMDGGLTRGFPAAAGIGFPISVFIPSGSLGISGMNGLGGMGGGAGALERVLGGIVPNVNDDQVEDIRKKLDVDEDDVKDALTSNGGLDIDLLAKKTGKSVHEIMRIINGMFGGFMSGGASSGSDGTAGTMPGVVSKVSDDQITDISKKLSVDEDKVQDAVNSDGDLDLGELAEKTGKSVPEIMNAITAIFGGLVTQTSGMTGSIGGSKGGEVSASMLAAALRVPESVILAHMKNGGLDVDSLSSSTGMDPSTIVASLSLLSQFPGGSGFPAVGGRKHFHSYLL